jgi:hypothetical protein
VSDDRPQCDHLVAYPMDYCLDCIKADRDRLAAELVRLRRALTIIEDRHHPDSEWCDEAKEVLG